MITTSTLILLAALFFAIAALYASVGFGGGSSYLAILSLYVKDFLLIKTTGLLCNLVVVSSGSYLFGKKGYFDAKKALPVAAAGVPLAFYGATIRLEQKAFFIALGSVLALSGVLLLLQIFWKRHVPKETRSTPVAVNILLGGAVGFLAGLVGIGGGILLSPLLNLMGWDSPKKIAAVASFFILVNSLAGLAGQAVSGTLKIAMPMLAVLLLAVFLGGQLGSRLSVSALKPALVKGLTGILVCYIGAKLVVKHTLCIDI